VKIIIDETWLAEIKKFLTPDEKESVERQFRWTTGKGKVKLSIADWSDGSIQKLHDFLGVEADNGNLSAKRSQTAVWQWIEIKTNPNGQSVSKLENVEPAMKKYIGASEHRYLFQETKDENFVPWFVEKIVYHEATQHSPAHVNVELLAINSGGEAKRHRGQQSYVEGKSFSIGTEDIRKRTMSQILEAEGYFLETPERMASYEKEMVRFVEFCDQDGFQMSVTGKGYLMDGWSRREFRTVGQNGRPAKMVIDPPERERESNTVYAEYWDKNEEHVWQVPVQPIYEMFDLEEHADYRIHVNNAEPYVYDDKVDQKLVLPQDVKDFLTVLIEHSKNKFEDIVGGKEGGTIVLIEGLPGIGKTLTAEVYSEKMHRPLYKVQSSQLGISVKDIEENLKTVLQRSERWGAILLIDEADVYIHMRGDDIVQNAIVGVMLRVLEYYRGVLFMTTNRGTIVDDAIISRTMARFLYQMPNESEQKQLWRVLSEQNGIQMSDEQIDQIVKTLSNISGRDIKNLLKLAMVAAENVRGVVTPELVKMVSKFKQSGTTGSGRTSGLIPDRKTRPISRDEKEWE
jgi:hypothetical protein